MEPPQEVVAYYERFAEELRLDQGPFQLEFARTKDILGRLLPPRPTRVVDVGGAAGAYSAWLADQGHEVHLVDASPRLVEEARKRNATLRRPIASFAVADARLLPQPSNVLCNLIKSLDQQREGDGNATAPPLLSTFPSSARFATICLPNAIALSRGASAVSAPPAPARC